MRTLDENMVNVQHEKANGTRPADQSDAVAPASSLPVSEPSNVVAQSGSLKSGAGEQSASSNSSVGVKLIVPLAAIVLSILVFACFGRTLSNYFLADDFSEIWWVSQIFRGNTDFLWSTLAGNYMTVPGMAVWRPCLLTSLMCDFALWGTDARGYYLTNLLYFAGDVLLLNFVARELLSSWTRWRRELASFFSAALFAVSPLHCESISWVVGRVDIISCFYYLASFLFLLKSRNLTGRKKHLHTALAVACFWIGLFTKEMAIGLPAIVALVGFLFPAQAGAALLSAQTKTTTLRIRLLEALRLSLPLWLSVLVYFPLRFLVLGTFVGGYVDGFGSAQMAAMVQKWLDPDIIARLIYPLNFAVFGKQSFYSQALSACYIVATGVIVCRAFLSGLPWRWLAFLGGWALTAAVPIFQLWGLGENLEGSRFYFFLTLPASLLLPVLLFAPSKSKSGKMLDAISESAGGSTFDAFRSSGSMHGSSREESSVLDRLNFKLSIVASISLLALTATLFGAAYKSNLVWVHAGGEVRAFWESCKKLASSAPEQTRFVILGIPKQHCGAHQILNGPTFSIMLDAPFTSRKLVRSFLTFDPIMYGAADKINDTRFKECLTEPGVRGPLVWNGGRKSFDEILLPQPSQGVELSSASGHYNLLSPQDQNGLVPVQVRGRASYRISSEKLVLDHVNAGDTLVFTGLDLNPLQVDFLRLGIKIKSASRPLALGVTWNDDVSNRAEITVSPKAGEQSVMTNVHLSHYWRWYASPAIRELAVELPPCELAEIEWPTLVPSTELMPTIRVAREQASPAGVYRLSDSGSLDLVLEPNQAGNLVVNQGGSSELAKTPRFLEIEISKPNFFFVNFTDDRQAAAVGSRVRLEPGRTSYRLDGGNLPVNGFYDVRCRVLNGDGTPASEYSNPVTVSKVR